MKRENTQKKYLMLKANIKNTKQYIIAVKISLGFILRFTQKAIFGFLKSKVDLWKIFTIVKPAL